MLRADIFLKSKLIKNLGLMFQKEKEKKKEEKKREKEPEKPAKPLTTEKVKFPLFLKL